MNKWKPVHISLASGLTPSLLQAVLVSLLWVSAFVGETIQIRSDKYYISSNAFLYGYENLFLACAINHITSLAKKIADKTMTNVTLSKI